MENEQKQLVIVSGVEGSGKSTFSRLFKNSFLRSLSKADPSEALKSEKSFYYETDLANPEEIALFEKAKGLDYKITIYYLFSGKLLAAQRAKLRSLIQGDSFDEEAFKTNYEASYKGLANCYSFADVIFFIKNQKQLLFLAAYDPKTTKKETYLSALEKLENEVDAIR
jgi:predicted ABC-type ATPase